MMMKIITLIVTLIFSQHSWGGDFLPMTIENNNNQFSRCDSYTLRYGLIIKVAEIGWYAPDCDTQKPLMEVPNKILRFHYFKNVSADFFKESAEEYFLLNLDNQEQQERLLPTLKEFNAGYTDIKSGEYFDLVHWDDSKLSLLKNDELLTAADEAVFAHKYFNIWFGPHPVIKKLRQAFE